MSAGSDTDPPEEISRNSEHLSPARDVARTDLRRTQERERNVTALREALIEGENSGEAAELDMQKIKAKA